MLAAVVFETAEFASKLIKVYRGSQIIMQAANRLQKALKTGSGLTFGAWQMLPGTNQARVIARSGVDWQCVDTEHGNIDGNLDPLAGFTQTATVQGGV